MPRVKTFTNGGSFLPGDLNAIQDDYENAFSGWRPFARRSIDITPSTTTSWVALTYSGGDGVASPTRASQAAISIGSYDAGGRVASWRLKVYGHTNTVAPGTTITVKAQSFAVDNGASATAPRVSESAGSDVVGATAAVTTPGSSGSFNLTSAGTFALAEGAFALWAKPTATLAANSVVLLIASLEYRLT